MEPPFTNKHRLPSRNSYQDQGTTDTKSHDTAPLPLSAHGNRGCEAYGTRPSDDGFRILSCGVTTTQSPHTSHQRVQTSLGSLRPLAHGSQHVPIHTRDPPPQASLSPSPKGCTELSTSSHCLGNSKTTVSSPGRRQHTWNRQAAETRGFCTPETRKDLGSFRSSPAPQKEHIWLH